MDIGICVASHVGDVDYVVRAEALGFSHAWLADSQMIWSDCYATLALAAERTSTICIGTGVSVSGTRPAPVTAASIATINALAPGRTFLGVGTGNTAMRIMGKKPHRIAEFDAYLSTLRKLLRGEEAVHEGKRIRHLMADHGFVNFEDPIPLHVSGFGPRSLGLAGKHADGVILAMPPSPDVLTMMLGLVDAGAREAGRTIDPETFPTTALVAVSVLDAGEDAGSDRVKSECGAMAMATVHYLYDQWRQFGNPPPSFLVPMWDDYRAMLAKVPDELLHQRIHQGHNCWVLPEEERFVTRELIEATCLVGTKEELAERLQGFEAAGLDQIMLLPAWEPRYEVIERVGRDLLPLLR